MSRDDFTAQVKLLIRVLPHAARENIFALKGGTAINLFYRNLPRLSVDIDLTYLPIKNREESLAEINAAMDRIAASIEKDITGASAVRIDGGGSNDTRISVRLDGVAIKIETSPVLRGAVYDPQIMRVSEAAEEQFGFAEIPVVSFEDLYGGKLCAALDRQHPRDLYDVKLLYENEGITDALFRTFLVYVASSPRPPHELLNPNPIDLAQAYEKEFRDMTTQPVNLEELNDTRAQLINDIQSRLDDKACRFLLSLHNGAPDFDIIGRPQAAQLPAVQWKLINLNKLKTADAEKHANQRQMLADLLLA